MKRKIYKRLLEWKNNDAKDTAILIDGARRVGNISRRDAEAQRR